MQPVRVLPSVLAGLLALPAGAAAQDIADNIRPVGRVCLEGQACVGTFAEAAVADAASAAVRFAAPEAPEPAGDGPPAGGAGAAPAPAAFDAEAAYRRTCLACHLSGAGGAPKPDDAAAWEARLEKGMDAVVANVIDGMGAMPPRGLCLDCSDGELRAVVEHMLSR